jgi:hypothetical protein
MTGAAFRGACRVCGGDYSITVKNVIGKHSAPVPEFADAKGKCLGGGRPPAGRPEK